MSLNNFDLEYLTAREVARILRCKPETVQAYVRDGRLAGTKVGRSWLISRAAVRDFMARR